MSGLPPRPISPGALSSRSSPHRGRRLPSPIVPQRRPPSPRMHRSRSRERANGASRYRPRSPPYSRERAYDTYVPPSDRNRTREREWERYDRYVPLPSRWPPEPERELEMERRRRDRAADDLRHEYERDRGLTRHIPPEGYRPRWRERSISPEWRSNGSYNRPLTPPRQRSPDRYAHNLRSPYRRDWAHSPRRRVSPPRRSRSPRSPHREEHPQYRREPSPRHSSRRQGPVTPPARRAEPPPLSPGELEDLNVELDVRIKPDTKYEAKKREWPLHPSASPPPGESRGKAKELSPRLPPSPQHQSPRSQTPVRSRESLPPLPDSSASPSASKGDESAEEHKRGFDHNSEADTHGNDGIGDGQKVGSLTDIPAAKRRPSLTPKLDAEIAEAVASGKKAASERARLSAELRRARQELALATLDLVFAEDRRKIAERQRANMEKGLPLDAFDGLVRDGMVDDMGILAASAQSVAVDVSVNERQFA